MVKNDNNARKNEMIAEMNRFLNGMKLHVTPSLKVNGSAFPQAVIAVDFGVPLEPVKLTTEQNAEVGYRMKELTTALTGRRSVRVNYDNSNGIYWTNV